MGRAKKNRTGACVAAATLTTAPTDGHWGVWLPEHGPMDYAGQGITAADYSEARGFI